MSVVRNYTVFKAAHLHSKFWTHNSIMVPDRKVVLNEDFADIKDILRVHSQHEHFKVYWLKKGITGSVCLPGDWNYCYVDGKFFHMEKGESNGFIKDVEGEWFFYTLMYDDWQNEWLTNNFEIKGTINLTGDRELALEKINQISPMLDNVNRFVHLNGIRYTEGDIKYETQLKMPERPTEKFIYPYSFNSFEKQRINDLLKDWRSKVGRGEMPDEPPMDRLHIPFMYRLTKPTNWKWHLLSEIRKTGAEGFHVFDVTVGGGDAVHTSRWVSDLKKKLHTEELYTVATKENKKYTYAKSVNESKWISEIDLSNCRDLTFLDRSDLEPYDRPSRTGWNSWTVRGLVDWICEKQGWSGSDLKEKMRSIFDEVCFQQFAPFLEHYDENRDGVSDERDFEKKLFWNVTMEKINRDIIDTNDVRGEVKNPEWRDWLPRGTRIADTDLHRNNVWDNAHEMVVMQGFYNKDPTLEDAWGKPFNYDTATAEEKEAVRKIIEGGSTKTLGGRQNSVAMSWYTLVPDNNYFIYLPDEHKLTTEEKNRDHLDFTKNNLHRDNWFALIPDYHTKSYVPAFKKGDWSPRGSLLQQPTTRATNPRIALDTSNSIYRDSVYCKEDKPEERCMIDPFILTEIKREVVEDVGLDWKKAGADFYEAWLNLGKDITGVENKVEGRTYPADHFRHSGARILARGFLFSKLITTTTNKLKDYHESFLKSCPHLKPIENNVVIPSTIIRLTTFSYYADCTALRPESYGSGKNLCYSYGTEIGDAYYYGKSLFGKTKALYKNPERTWRDHDVEFTMPVKVDGFDVLAKLKEYEDLPNEFLCWEVINTNKKKGPTPPVNVRILKQVKAGDDPMGTIATDEEQAKIPPNTVVRIYITTVKLQDNSEDAQHDEDVKQRYEERTKKTLEQRLNKLLAWLHNYFFLEEWERGPQVNEPAGAIPNRIQVLDPAQYPKNEIGQSQLALNYWKPFHGFWYMAWTRFYAPPPTKELMRLDAYKIVENWDSTYDWLINIVPTSYHNSNYYTQYYSNQQYRDKVPNLTRNTQLSIIFSGLIPTGSTKDGKYVSFGQYKPIDIEAWNEPLNRVAQQYIWNNKDSYQWDGADMYYYEWITYLRDWDTLLLNDFIRNAKTYKTRKMVNLVELPPVLKYTPTAYENEIVINTSTLENDIPDFMIEFLNPEDPRCWLHGNAARPVENINTDAQRLALWREWLAKTCDHTLKELGNWPMWFKLDGTDWWASVKLNIYDQVVHWDYELFTDRPDLIKTKDKERWRFANTFHEKDVDVLINSRYELTVHGTRFQLKGRSYVVGNEDEIDVGLEVKPIEDNKQSLAAIWYWVHMNYGDVDVIKTIIETPKELVKYTDFDPYAREKMIRELGIQHEEYLYEKATIEFDRDENKFMKKYQEDTNYTDWKYAVARGGLQIAGSVIDVAADIATSGASAMARMILPKRPYLTFHNTAGKVTGRDANLDYFYSPFDSFVQGMKRPWLGTPVDRYSGRGRPPNQRYIVPHFGSRNWMHNRQQLKSFAMESAQAGYGGLAGIVSGALTIAKAGEDWRNENYRIQNEFRIAEERLAAKGDITNKRYDNERINLLNDIYAQSANTFHPSMNSNLIYKLYNKEVKLENVYLTVYYPGGKLKNYLSEFYKEYGYEILARDFICHGAAEIKRHLRYQFIYEINHSNEDIKKMLEGRALMGIKMIE